ncbi:uncharacterized protein LAJ45_10125 [Morchella importuna]|uniref:uncharacterized protein n=1 Tax=Morchella importuna TaxID=1174673 RepID=UPI001E8CEA07|nr:uncharacterized protein LAJ45_10125 [Morchella importuna]KAH8145802.1 hypothetical protein LAJ45_10125 [Morchella importuna]
MKIIVSLQHAQSKIRFTLGGSSGTSPNNQTLLGIIANFTDEDRVLRESVYRLKGIKVSNMDQNMAHIIGTIIEDYSIKSQFGYGMMDYASNNDTPFQHLRSFLQEARMQLNHEQCRLRYKGHIINFSVNDFLFGSGSDMVEDGIFTKRPLKALITVVRKGH